MAMVSRMIWMVDCDRRSTTIVTAADDAVGEDVRHQDLQEAGRTHDERSGTTPAYRELIGHRMNYSMPRETGHHHPDGSADVFPRPQDTYQT